MKRREHKMSKGKAGQWARVGGIGGVEWVMLIHEWLIHFGMCFLIIYINSPNEALLGCGLGLTLTNCLLVPF